MVWGSLFENCNAAARSSEPKKKNDNFSPENS